MPRITTSQQQPRRPAGAHANHLATFLLKTLTVARMLRGMSYEQNTSTANKWSWLAEY
jgi:ribosomal protein L22